MLFGIAFKAHETETLEPDILMRSSLLEVILAYSFVPAGGAIRSELLIYLTVNCFSFLFLTRHTAPFETLIKLELVYENSAPAIARIPK